MNHFIILIFFTFNFSAQALLLPCGENIKPQEEILKRLQGKKIGQVEELIDLRKEKLATILKQAQRQHPWDYENILKYSEELLSEMEAHWTQLGYRFKRSESRHALILEGVPPDNIRPPFEISQFVSNSEDAFLDIEFNPLYLLTDQNLPNFRSYTGVNDGLINYFEVMNLSVPKRHKFLLNFEEAIQGRIKIEPGHSRIHKLRSDAHFISFAGYRYTYENAGPAQKRLMNFLNKLDMYDPRSLWPIDKKNQFTTELLQLITDHLNEIKQPYTIEGKKIILSENRHFCCGEKSPIIRQVFDPDILFVPNITAYRRMRTLPEHQLKYETTYDVAVDLTDLLNKYPDRPLTQIRPISGNNNHVFAEIENDLFDNVAFNQKLFYFWTTESIPTRVGFSLRDIIENKDILIKNKVIDWQRGAVTSSSSEIFNNIFRDRYIINSPVPEGLNNVDLLDLMTVLTEPLKVTNFEKGGSKYDAFRTGSPIVQVKRDKGLLSIIDFTVDPKLQELDDYRRFLLLWLNHVEDQYSKIKTEWTETKGRLLSFFENKAVQDRTILLTETKNILDDLTDEEVEFISGIVFTRVEPQKNQFKHSPDFDYNNFDYKDKWDRESADAFWYNPKTKTFEAAGYPMDLAFYPDGGMLNLEHRFQAGELSKLFDFNPKGERIDPINTFIKYIRLLYHRYRNDQTLRYIYFHSMGFSHTKYYTGPLVKATIEKISLPKLASGKYDFSIFDKDSPYMQIDAIGDLWQRIQSKIANNKSLEDIIIGPSYYAKKQLEETGSFEPDLIFIVDLDDWKEVTAESYQR